MVEPLTLTIAYALDLLIGDPEWLPHPVRWMGWGIAKMERLLRWMMQGLERLAGVFLVLIIVGLTYEVSSTIDSLLASYPSPFTFLIGVYLTSTTLATKELIESGRSVINPLKTNNIYDARKRLSHIVGRDTERLDKMGISMATIETLAENTSDGIIAPLFYFVIGGISLAMTYKAINTLDSMVGYKDERYKDLGWAAARLDDLANYLPARITGILIVISSAIVSRSIFTGYHSLRTMLRDGRRHTSPNSGIPEAAMAGALGIRLGGPSTYGGVVVDKPYIGDETNRTEDSYLEASLRAVAITKIASLLGFGGALIILFIRSVHD